MAEETTIPKILGWKSQKNILWLLNNGALVNFITLIVESEFQN